MAFDRLAQPHQPDISKIDRTSPDMASLRKTCSNISVLVTVLDSGCAPLAVYSDDPKQEPHICIDSRGDTPRPLQVYEGTTLFERTLALLKQCGFPRAHVLTSGRVAAALQVIAQGAKVDCVFELVDPAVDAHMRSNMKGFSVFNIGGQMLDACIRSSKSDGTSAVMVLPCDMPRLQPRHIAKLVEALKSHPAADVVASWITWFSRPPYILCPHLLQNIDSVAAACARDDLGYRPAPKLDVINVLFGEERLEATPSADDKVDEYFKNSEFSAAWAVAKAKSLIAGAAKEMYGEGFVGSERSAAGAVSETENARSYYGQEVQRAAHKASGELKVSLVEKIAINCAIDVICKAEQAFAATFDEKASLDLAVYDKWAVRNRADFPIFSLPENKKDLVYLDSAATSQHVGRAIDAQSHFEAYECANIYRGSYKLSAAATARVNDARAVLEAHINADRRQTIYTKNTSDSASVVAAAWGDVNIKEGDRIVLATAEHHSNMLPWQMLASRHGAQVVFIDYLPDGRLDMDGYRRVLAEGGVKLVCVAHVSNVVGLENPVAEMAEAAHAVGARIYVDGAQSFPHMKIDVKALGCDFFAASAHKAYGPFGVGILWVAPAAFDEMDPACGGGGTVAYVGKDEYYLRAGAIQYELGTPDISGEIGMAASVEYMDALGMDAVQAHAAVMTHYLMAALSAVDGAATIGDHTQQDGLGGLVSFNIDGVSSANVAKVVGRLGVCVRAGGHCALPLANSLGVTGSVRFSFGVYTTKDDILAGVVAAELARRIYASA
jgi:cysteine desulfurase/selenocysteine lyase